MGYYARCTDSRIRIADESAALTALKAANAKTPLTNATMFSTNESLSAQVARAASLGEALEVLDWELLRGPDGAVVGLAFDNKFDLFEFEATFTALAPFIAEGSTLEMEGEDSEGWRATFKKGRMHLDATRVYLTFEVTDSRVGIVDEQAALAALRAENERAPLLPGDDSLLHASSLDEALDGFDWEVVRDGGKVVGLSGDWAPFISDVSFTTRILSRFSPRTMLRVLSSDRLLDTLAPFVTAGSYVIIGDELDRCWKVSFEAGRASVKKWRAD